MKAQIEATLGSPPHEQVDSHIALSHLKSVHRLEAAVVKGKNEMCV